MKNIRRREFIQQTASSVAATTAAASLVAPVSAQDNSFAKGVAEIFDFKLPDSLVHPRGWETLNPGYWKIENGALRRRLTNLGDRARGTGFPFHYMSKGTTMRTDYDPSLHAGVIYRSDVRMQGDYKVVAAFTYQGADLTPKAGDDPNWKMYQRDYGYFGIALGAKSLMESYGKIRNTTQAIVGADGKGQFIAPKKKKRSQDAGELALKEGDQVTIELEVKFANQSANVAMTVSHGGESTVTETKMPRRNAVGFVGIVGRGLLDFQVDSFEVKSKSAERLTIPEFDCYVCYPLGDTLHQDANGRWTARFVSMFASDGEKAEIRIADSPDPVDGWSRVAVAGTGAIVNNSWRRNTCVINATLPANPADATMYYTIWKDGKNVTADTRIGTNAVGPGTGYVGDVPASGSYVGRLPQLKAPYKMCGLSCHAITSGLQMAGDDGYKIKGGGDDWQFRDQPTQGAYKHLEDYDFQVMLWEDDVWYMELVMYPPSTDDAYEIVTQSICGPTSRWQMMRHWNVINPGDHDYGMDDIKGPEQLVIRSVPGLGQDITYIQRNFQIVHHLTTGAEEADPLENPKKWRAWKMPNRDFTFVILDSRLWRSSQDTDMWDDSGWDKFKSLYDRTDPTRSLLGEEQFGWLQQLITTDASRLICLTGINGMHTVWTGGKGKSESSTHPKKFSQRDRVTADYAGWVKAGSDRVIELLGSRDGIVTVYGDVHNGCIIKNKEHNLIECSFGPIGRSGGRGVIPGFGPEMQDVDGRDVTIHSLYHKEFADAQLNRHAPGDPFYWNFLEMEFDPTKRDPKIGLRVRNMIDSPKETPRGGGALETTASRTGRKPTSTLPAIKTLPNADVRFTTMNGVPIRASRSDRDGDVHLPGLVDIPTGTRILMLAFDGSKTESKTIETI